MWETLLSWRVSELMLVQWSQGNKSSVLPIIEDLPQDLLSVDPFLSTFISE